MFFKQRLCIFSQKLSNKNKQQLYKIPKQPSSLFYHMLLIKQNECILLKSVEPPTKLFNLTLIEIYQIRKATNTDISEKTHIFRERGNF